MKLARFSIQKYRSIRTAEKLVLGDLAVLIGPNNEGKSNILSGLVEGMRILSRLNQISPQATASRKTSNSIAIRYFRNNYVWERDFPIGLQGSQPQGNTILEFQFELTDDEVDEFKQEVKSNLNGLLPVKLLLGPNQLVFEVPKKGPGGSALSAKHRQIARFVSRRINLREIPAIRTAQDTINLVDEMVADELSELEASIEYREAVDRISELQRPLLEGLGENLASMMQRFLPDVKSVRIGVVNQYEALRENSHVFVDDGTETELSQKGDGVQSLAAVALIHQVAQDRAKGRELVLAIEEPEAHLHSSAIHQLRGVLVEIAATQQVIVTTHSPLLANRVDIASNIIVDRNRARAAKSIAEIRRTLGVRVADNLAAAEVVLLVEGEDDRESLLAVLPSRSAAISEAISQGRLAFDSLNGGTNAVYKFASYRDQLCLVHCLLDHDATGISAGQKVQTEGLATPADVSYATHPSLKDSELEDLWDQDMYVDLIRNGWNVDLLQHNFSKRKKKWSDKVEDCFVASGQHWDDDVCNRVKISVAQKVASDPTNALLPALAGPIDALCAALEAKLNRV